MKHRQKRKWIVAFIEYPDVIAKLAKAFAQMGLPRHSGSAVINHQTVGYAFYAQGGMTGKAETFFVLILAIGEDHE